MEGMGQTVSTLNVNHWTDRNVLVTGCTGLLGSWITEELVALGANVVGLVRDRVPKSRLVQNSLIDQITVVAGEVRYPPSTPTSVAHGSC
jgi:uncharacterized protein YbjT (DUF2867 family)